MIRRVEQQPILRGEDLGHGNHGLRATDDGPGLSPPDSPAPMRQVVS